MVEEDFDPEIECTKMFKDKPDEELALHIIQKFNICRDTVEEMPAFKKHLEPLFLSKNIEKDENEMLQD